MTSKSLRVTRVALGAALGMATLAGTALASGEVNVYSARQEVLIRPLFDAFTKSTGIKVNVVSGGEDALIERLKTEGINSPADIMLTVDAGRLIRTQENGSLQPVKTPTLDANVPAHFRDPQGYWYGLSVRARPIMYSTARVKPSELSTYADLASDKWKGKICVRTSSHIYNQSLLASMIAHQGVEKTEAWAKAFAGYLARKPQGGDRDQIKAVAAGECDIAIVNTYYLAGMIGSGTDEDKKQASQVAVFWPDQAGNGTHVNISGAGVTAGAKNKENAIKLIEYLTSDEAQKIYAATVYEYPIRANIQVGKPLSEWGEFKADTLNLAAFAKHNPDAVKITDRVGWR
jgi:iron(III) transport system substrate-binding protein